MKLFPTLHSDVIFITKEYNMELNRFKQLLESTMGNVKPLIMEQETGNTITLNSEYFKTNPTGVLKTSSSIVMSVNGIENNQSISGLRSSDKWVTWNEVPNVEIEWNYTVSGDTLNLEPINKKFSAKYSAFIKN